jgi:uncharacterized cupin superfamily protein
MRYFNTKSKNNRGIVGISGVLLLILGAVSLIFQYSTTVEVYAQVNLGPLINIGDENDRSDSLDSDSDGRDIFVAFSAQGVQLGKLLSGPGGRAESLDGEPQVIINGGTDPAIDVTPGGQAYVAAEQQGEIAFVECADDVDSCTSSKIVSNPPPGPPVGIEGEGSSTENSCRDRLDNDGDNRRDIADPDCQWASEGESTVHGLCSDGLDNDDDGVIDSDDEDCFQPAETAGGADTAETAGAEDNDTAGVEPTSFNLQPGTTTSPQLTFVSTDGGDGPPASNTDIAKSDNGEHVYVVWEHETTGEIMLAASHNNGGTWGAEINVSNTPGASTNARVATSADGQFVYVIWQDTPGNGDIFYARLTNFGGTLEPSINLSNTSGRSCTDPDCDDHQLLAEGSNVYVVWVDYTTRSGGDIYFRKIGNNGDPESISNSNTINLSAESGQSFQAARDPDMAAQGSKVSVTWAAHPDRNAVRAAEILFRESANNGDTFGNSVNVSQTPRTDSKEPQVDYTPAIEGGEIYLAFHDTGGPRRLHTSAATATSPIYNVLATESDNGRTFSALVNLSDAPNNDFLQKSTSQLEVIFDVAIWDPTSRRG